ncbi:uncharacterized protein [Physcomitrium patens]|uniref:Stress response protein nst1 n=1 Tax=Physcomitrium patens TaxID=3218 RepID=A0A7I4B2D8_PHYPA|nr:uncharacterized protein LOC112293613 isoform X2 [Physcomitrium patens]|eukprot:XP_024399022.1 uncharacterized protein LOC112293613 isoform X2 [Physcomitrella patens]
MPSLLHKALPSTSASHFNVSDARPTAVWTRSNTDDVTLSQLHKFWGGLSVVARRDLLRIDKQTLFEQVRKNLYCSRCHGLLVEGFNQIVFYGKTLQAGMVGHTNGSGTNSRQVIQNGYNAGIADLSDDSRDPSVHPWGGLAATRDSMLTVLDCFLDGMQLEVFESARARERERELLYPDACGGGGRGWISQNGSFNGRGHGLKEACALHTARLSCEALVDFWSALGDETRRSLLRMKEEDFIERLIFRFNSKRFCRDCRRNVLREFKEMKELKRSRREPQCTRWFCAADTVFRYEVSESAVQVDWHDCFVGDGSIAFQRFEWALGTGEGKSDIIPYEDVGLSESAYVDSLDLASISACFITVRGWKRDGRCTELSAKAHALKGQLCVHRRLIVGDGYLSITQGESIQRFFERAEQTEEEEDEDAIDNDGNDYEGEASRPQKHAKSPELARDFLLDAATVIFKEQVEKAFREGTARQNAHSIFVCVALSLLEERVRVACKEITSLEKQKKLLEEEEREKREEEERRERRKQKEREKKLRRKEKLKSKVKCNRMNCTLATLASNECLTASSQDEEHEEHEEEQESNSGSQVEGIESNISEDSRSARPSSPDMIEARPSADGFDRENGGTSQHETFAPAQVIDDPLGLRNGNGAFIVERSKSVRRRTRDRKPTSPDNSNGSCRTEAENSTFGNPRTVPNAHFFIKRGAISSQVQQRNGPHKFDAGTTEKEVDISCNINNKHEILQSCACGSPHVGSRFKIGNRGPGKLGIRDANGGSRSGERVDLGSRSSKMPNEVGNLDPAISQKPIEYSLEKSITATTFERRGQRAGNSTDKPTKAVHSRSSSLDLSNSYHGGSRLSPNGFARGHGYLDNGPGLPVVVKPTWTPRAVNSSISSNGVTVKVLAAGRRPLDSVHERSDSLCHAQAKPGSPWIAGPKSTSPKAISVIAVEFSESRKDEPCVSEISCTSEEGEDFTLTDSNAPIPVQTCITADDGQEGDLATGTDTKGDSVSLTTSTSDSSSKTLPVQREPLVANAQGYAVPEERTNTESRPGASCSEQGVQSLHVPSSVATTQIAANMVLLADSPSPRTHCSSSPSGTLSETCPHLHASGHQLVNCPQDNLLRPPCNGPIYPFATDMSSSQGPLHYAIPPPNLAPSSLNMHHPFGFYPVSPWAAHGRTSVLQMPQAGGYTVAGPGGLCMAVLPPMSLNGPGPMPPVGLGHLPAILDGLNPLQLREQHQNTIQQVFLSRFGIPGKEFSSRGIAERVPCFSSENGWSEGAVAADVGHSSENRNGHVGQAVSNASSPFPGVKDRRPTDSPTTAVFSLFHSKWPITGGANEKDGSLEDSNSDASGMNNLTTNGAEKPQCMGGSDELRKSSSSAGEYSLFASAPSNGFGFF